MASAMPLEAGIESNEARSSMVGRLPTEAQHRTLSGLSLFEVDPGDDLGVR